MEQLIHDYLNHLKQKHGIVAAMVTGSYVTGQLGPRSDIDLFCLWEDEARAIRGREFFGGREFEYFISPEWKYYARMETERDLTSQRVYAGGRILLDSAGRMQKIQDRAKDLVASYAYEMSEQERKGLKFYLETIGDDVMDLLEQGDQASFQLFVAAHLQNICNIACKLSGAMPVYMKYGLHELREVDSLFADQLRSFLTAEAGEREATWKALLGYLQAKLGDFDIGSYESVQILKRPTK